MITWFDSEFATRLAGGFAAVAFLLVGGIACGSATPIHHYQPQVATKQLTGATSQSSSDLVLAVEDFSAGAAYDERRIIYREGPYKFDYYHYHRWSAPPGMLVSDALREVYRSTGAFRAVVSGYATRADVMLSGRVLAIEEVDVTKKKWLGRLVVDLRLRDAVTGEMIWTTVLRREVKLDEQSPKGLAAAISKAITDIGVSTADDIVAMGKQSVRTHDKKETSQNPGAPSPEKSSEAEKADGEQE